MPPSRARAIASRASVTVSIAAETIGISSEIVRVSRVTVETSLGRTADSAGTSSTSSKVKPSLLNFPSRSVANSKSLSTLPTVPTPSFSLASPAWRRDLGPGDRLELVDLDERRETGRLLGIETTGTDLEH